MKKILNILFVGSLVLFFLLFISIFFGNEIDNINPFMKSSMINTTLEWGRFAEFPESKYDFDIYTTGTMFTRGYRCSFYLPEKDLYKWIKESPGLQEASIHIINESKKRYNIEPGGGALHAEAIIDFNEYFIEIYTYWS
ncbi:MAG: hypothetical protein ACOCQW_02715 [Halanaerobiaceae bacterium]